MTQYYNLWIEIEEVDEDRNLYRNLDDLCVKLARTSSLEEAIEFARSLESDFAGSIVE